MRELSTVPTDCPGTVVVILKPVLVCVHYMRVFRSVYLEKQLQRCSEKSGDKTVYRDHVRQEADQQPRERGGRGAGGAHHDPPWPPTP